MRHETIVDIQAGMDAVWPVLRDVTDWPDWCETVERVSLLGDGPFGVGTRARVKQPKMTELTWEVTELTPDSSFTWRTKGPGYVIEGGHFLTPLAGEGTRARLTLDVTGPLAPLLWLLTGSRTRRYVDREGACLKRRCERTP
ncbi:SRPBCC family protein [Amycolatopsis cynarae]|uniref:SRPBCC family protein n=1 Tax=Amycolatopsis cynarae TaxID=2995223 RepID=A0ABY7B9S3_9PSEU|nr:SRPBCC family protein [Amycolatopsis sp. HUAS 11-8]WAL68154.1 SRPBCC family protein [Amycolatopsis sp. HUAS 11-8]